MPDKEIWVPANAMGVGQGGMTFYGDFAVARCAASNHFAYMSFFVPVDFVSLVSAAMIVIPRLTRPNGDWDIYADYGEVGQDYHIHEEFDNTTAYNVVAGTIFSVDISGILTGIAVGDKVGISLRQPQANHDVDILGLFIIYSQPAAGGSGAVGGSGPGAVGAVVGAAGGIGGHGSGGLRPF